jgi:acyl-CoA synthetase (NDP forming)
MVREIKGFKLLEGYRGSPPADVAALESLLLKVSEFVDAHPEVAELDLNPVFAYPDGAVAVDARIVLAESLCTVQAAECRPEEATRLKTLIRPAKE